MVAVDLPPQRCRDYFDLFGLSPDFDIDGEDLTRRFHKLQAQFHPDRYQGGTPTEMRVAAQVSAEINAGYTTLRDPVARAGFMLERLGVRLRDVERQPVAGEFLLRQMELREAVLGLEPEDIAGREALMEEAHSLFLAEQSNFRSAMASSAVDAAGTAWQHLLFLDKLRRELGERLN